MKKLICITTLIISRIAFAQHSPLENTVWALDCNEASLSRSWVQKNDELNLYVLTKDILTNKVIDAKKNGDIAEFIYASAEAKEEYAIISPKQIMLKNRILGGKQYFENGIDLANNKPSVPLNACAKNSKASMALYKSIDAYNLASSCYIMDTKNTTWATGGNGIKSCNPKEIQQSITEQFGTISIWQYKNDHEILHSIIMSDHLNSKGQNNQFIITTFTRQGKLLTETFENGCQQMSEITGETKDSLLMKSVGSKNCNQAVQQSIELSKLRPPSKYIKLSN